MPFNSLVIQVKPGDHDCWAIERSVVSVCSCSGVAGDGVMAHLDLEEEVDENYFSAYVVGLFQDLELDVDEECIRGDQRPSIMILAMQMPLMKRAMAAPKQMDLFPISCDSDPKVAFPPKDKHVVRRIWRM